jgi:hypothetical protein
VHDSGGVGNLGGSGGTSSVWAFNVSHDGNSGLHMGLNKEVLDRCVYAFNLLQSNDNYGLRLQNERRTWPITGITKANPAVITFPTKAVSAATNTSPITMTSTAHGLSSGEKVRVGNTQANWDSEMKSGGDPKRFRIHVIDADTIALYHEDEYPQNPIDGTSLAAYSGGAYLMHALDAETLADWAQFRSIGGMTQLNSGGPYNILNTTDTTGEIYTADDGEPVDSTGYGTYTSGGTAYAGGYPTNSLVIGNIMSGNGDAPTRDRLGAEMKIDDLRGDALTQTTDQHIHLFGNQYPQAANMIGYSPVNRVQDRNVGFFATRGANANNVTGNGTAYTIICNTTEYEHAECYAAGSGKFTAPHSGWFDFSGSIEIAGMGATVTSAILAIVVTPPLAGYTGRSIRSRILPPLGDNTAATWFGQVTAPRVYLEQDTEVTLVVTVSGIGADTADVVGSVDTWFSGASSGI